MRHFPSLPLPLPILHLARTAAGKRPRQVATLYGPETTR